MNSYSIQNSISPFQFLARNTQRFNHALVSDNTGIQKIAPDQNQPAVNNSPEKIIENQIIQGIQKSIGADSLSPANTNHTDFSPDKVADRILAFVNKTIGQLKNSDPNFDQDKFLSQVKQGIDTGFSDARDALNSVGLLKGQIKENLDVTYTKIQDGLSKFDLFNQTSASSVSELQGFSAQLKQSAEIEVVTKEGDVIKIRLNQSASVDQSGGNIQQNGISASAFQSNSEKNANFSVTVDGNLNENEQKSLRNLLSQMDQVGQDFFSGNTKSALNHVQQIGLDTQQIASFSMSLTMEKSVQAVAAYQQVRFPEQKIDPEQIKQAVDFFSHARDLLKTAQSALDPFENQMLAFTDLFNAVQQIGIQNNIDPNTSVTDSSLQQIIKPLGESVLQNEKPISA